MSASWPTAFQRASRGLETGGTDRTLNRPDSRLAVPTGLSSPTSMSHKTLHTQYRYQKSRKILRVRPDNHTKHINTPTWQTADLFMLM
jgi:hypothetical protein